jgi:hypothetical protein
MRYADKAGNFETTPRGEDFIGLRALMVIFEQTDREFDSPVGDRDWCR